MSKELIHRAEQIQTEVRVGANTAKRVGGVLADMAREVNGLYDNVLDWISNEKPQGGGYILTQSDVVNSLTDESELKPLSAKQGAILNKKIYTTSLKLFDIQDGSESTNEQLVEVENIMNKWNEGCIVTYVDDQSSSFYYGVLNVCRSSSDNPTTLSLINDSGDLLAYSVDPVNERIWSVTNKTHNNFYCFNSEYLLTHTDSLLLNEHDNALVNKLRSINTDLSDAAVAYCGIGDGDITQVVPLALHSKLSNTASDFNLKLCYAGESGNNYSLLITPTSVGSKEYVAEEPILVSGNNSGKKTKIYLYPTVYSTTKTISFYETTQKAGTWYILTLNIGASINGNNYHCYVSIPVRIPDTSDPFYTQAFMNYSNPIPIDITVDRQNVVVKLITSYTITSFDAMYTKTYLTEM